MHSEVKEILTEKIMKRKLKTPFQVEALENYYNEHKYPTESMKKSLADSIGLSEKQVSGWFCHRRLKDKRLLQEDAFGNGKHDRSSGVIQDLESGLRQDSCGSTKQGDCFEFREPKEVESRSNLTPVGLNYNHGRHFSGNVSETDDSSSETSSPLQSKNSLSDIRKAKTITRPSGYLKVKCNVENSAISAVKTQLGRHYREDGPALDVNFQTLPPGAFNSPLNMPANTLCSSSSPIHEKSASHPGIQRQPDLNMKREGSHLDDRMDCWDSYYRPGSMLKTSLLPNYKKPAAQSYYADRNEYPIKVAGSNSAKTMIKHKEFLDMEERESFCGMSKEDELYSENIRTKRACPDPLANSGKRICNGDAM